MSLPSSDWKHLRRLLRGPLADVVPLQDADGAPHIGICFPEDWSDHKALGKMPPPGSSVGVAGVAELVDADLGALVYAAHGRTVREVCSITAEDGGASLKAAIELTIAMVEIIDKAHTAELGPHRGLTPWRVALAEDGQVQIMGWGLSQLDIEDFLDDEEAKPSINSLRYCPPERLEDAEEDASTDRLVAALIAMEFLLGEAVHMGTFDEVLKAVEKGDAVDQLPELPEAADLAFSTLLASYPDERHTTSEECLADLRTALESADGKSLVETLKEAAEYASHEEVELGEKWVWPDGELDAEPGDDTVAEAPASDEPETLSPQATRALEASDRAASAAKSAGIAADKGVELGLREVEGVEAALDHADQRADDAIGAAENAKKAADSAREAKDESAAEAFAATAAEAAMAAEDAADQAKAAADKAIELSEAHRTQMRAAFMERLSTLRAQATEGQSIALTLPKMADHPPVQAAMEQLESQQGALQALEANLESALTRAESSDNAEAAEAAIAEIEATIAQRGEALESIAEAQATVRAADKKALEHHQASFETRIQESQERLSALQEAPAFGVGTLPEPAQELQERLSACIQKAKEATESTREALANHDFDTVEDALVSSQGHLEEATRLQAEIEKAVRSWEADRQERLDAAARSFIEQLEGLDALPETLPDPHEALQDAHRQTHEALKRARDLRARCEETRAALSQAQDIEALETALESAAAHLEEDQSATFEWHKAKEAYEEAQQQHQTQSELNAGREEAQRAYEQASSRAQEAMQAADRAAEASTDGPEALDTARAALKEARAGLKDALEHLEQAVQTTRDNSDLSVMSDLVNQTQEAAVHTHRSAQSLDDSTRTLTEAQEGAEHAERQDREDVLRRIQSLSDTLEEIGATRISSYEAARAATRPAGPRVADAWDAVEEAAEAFDACTQTIQGVLETLPDALENFVDQASTVTPNVVEAEQTLDLAKGHLTQMHEAVRSLEEAARLALADAQRITAAYEAGAALLVEVQSLSVGEAPELGETPRTPEVEATQSAHVQALSEASDLHQKAVAAAEAVSTHRQPEDAEAALEEARATLTEARNAAESARNAAQALSQVAVQAKDQQQALESSQEKATQALSVLSAPPPELEPIPDAALQRAALQPWVGELEAAQQALDEASERLRAHADTAAAATTVDDAERAAQEAIQAAQGVEATRHAYAEAHQKLQSAAEASAQATGEASLKLAQLREACADLSTKAGAMREQVQRAAEEASDASGLDDVHTLLAQIERAEASAKTRSEAAQRLQSRLDEEGASPDAIEALTALEDAAKSALLPDESSVQAVMQRLDTERSQALAHQAFKQALEQAPNAPRIEEMIAQANALEGLPDAQASIQHEGQRVLELLNTLQALDPSSSPECPLEEIPDRVAQVMETLQESYPPLETTFEQAVTANAQKQQQLAHARDRLTELSQQIPPEPETVTLLEEIARFLPHMTQKVAHACAGQTSSRAELVAALNTEGTDPDTLNQIIESATQTLNQVREHLDVIAEVRVLTEEAKNQASQAHQGRLETLSAEIQRWTLAREQVQTPAESDGLPEELRASVESGLQAAEAADQSIAPLHALRDQWADQAYGSQEDDAAALLEKATSALSVLTQAQADLHEAFGQAARKHAAPVLAKPIPDPIALGDHPAESIASSIATFDQHRQELDEQRLALTSAVETFGASPTADGWHKLLNLCEQLGQAHTLTVEAKQQVEENFRLESSPTERLRRRRERLEHLAEQEEAAAPSPAEAAPRRRRRRRDEREKDQERAPRRRRRNPASEEGPATESAERPSRRRTRSEGDDSSTPEDRSSRLERLRARRAQQGDEESARPRRRRDTSGDAPRRRRRRSDAATAGEPAPENPAPTRRRRMRDRVDEASDEDPST